VISDFRLYRLLVGYIKFIASSCGKEEVFAMKTSALLYSFAACLLFLFFMFCDKSPAQPANHSSQTASTSAADEAIPTAQLLQPEEFVQMLRSSGGEKPLVLQVGSHILYAEAHIPGSEYVGAGGQDAGLQALRDRVKGLERSGFLVIYCGCCPWNKCPNIRPAYRELHALGFTHVKVLYIADNFGADWVNKGYPVARGR
jgi:thiosulfate/3-mercaptopyruvate sulfurtransferase